ncbi:hypothetical protein LTR94_036612, partial [Friedmanniomyces endolithicus]
RLPAQRNLADPDDRPRRAQRGWPRDPLCRPDDRQHGTRHRRNRPPPGEAARIQPAARHHARHDQAQHPRYRGRYREPRRRAGGSGRGRRQQP